MWTTTSFKTRSSSALPSSIIASLFLLLLVVGAEAVCYGYIPSMHLIHKGTSSLSSRTLPAAFRSLWFDSSNTMLWYHFVALTVSGLSCREHAHKDCTIVTLPSLIINRTSSLFSMGNTTYWTSPSFTGSLIRISYVEGLFW